MADITPNVVIGMPSQLFTLARSFKGNANGKIYIGQIDTDPTIPSNQIQVYLENEDGSHVPVAQPIVINAGGYPVYNGQIAKFVTVQGHSMAIYDAYNVQQFYFPNVLKYDPDQLRAEINGKLIFPTDNLSAENVPGIYNSVSVKGTYSYLPAETTSGVNGISKIQSLDGRVWEMSGVSNIYASDFCTDTPSLQMAYEAAVSIQANFIIDAVFENLMCVTDDPLSPGNNAFKSVIRCVDNSVIAFIGDGALKLANQGRPQSHVIYLHRCKNVQIFNPVLFGDRLTNTTIGEHGWGLTVLQCENVYVRGGEYREMFGDGIYVGTKWGTTDDTVPVNVLIERPVIRNCRRNGISFCAGENVTINQPQIYDIGDYGGIAGAFPKAGIDVEPERDENTSGTSIPRIVNCVITDPCINGAYTGIDLNIFPENLIVELDIRGTVTLENVTNRGITATRLRSGGIGKISIDRVLFKTNPVDVVFLEMLGNDRISVEIGEMFDATTLAGQQLNIRLAPRAYAAGEMSNQFKNVRIGKLTSPISTYHIFAGTDLSQYFFDINIGQESDPIFTNLEFSPGVRPAQIRGYIGGNSQVTSFVYSNKLSSMLTLNHATNDTDVLVNTTGDFRKLCIRRALTTSSSGRATQIAGVRFVNSGTEYSVLSSTTFGAWVTLKNNEGQFTEITGMFGTWVYSN